MLEKFKERDLIEKQNQEYSVKKDIEISHFKRLHYDEIKIKDDEIENIRQV